MLLASAVPGCSSVTAEEPPLADSTMVEILIELTLAAARDDFQGDLTPALRDAIFARYGIDSVRFHEAVDYYADHPDAYAELYTTVLDRLSAERVRNSDPAPPSLPPGATPVLPPE